MAGPSVADGPRRRATSSWADSRLRRPRAESAFLEETGEPGNYRRETLDELSERKCTDTGRTRQGRLRTALNPSAGAGEAATSSIAAAGIVREPGQLGQTLAPDGGSLIAVRQDILDSHAPMRPDSMKRDETSIK